MRLSCFFASGRAGTCCSEYDCAMEGEEVEGVPASNHDVRVVGVVTVGVGGPDLPRDRSPMFGTSRSSGVQYYDEVLVFGIINVDRT